MLIEALRDEAVMAGERWFQLQETYPIERDGVVVDLPRDDLTPAERDEISQALIGGIIEHVQEIALLLRHAAAFDEESAQRREGTK
jgi:hypothetical protein